MEAGCQVPRALTGVAGGLGEGDAEDVVLWSKPHGGEGDAAVAPVGEGHAGHEEGVGDAGHARGVEAGEAAAAIAPLEAEVGGVVAAPSGPFPLVATWRRRAGAYPRPWQPGVGAQVPTFEAAWRWRPSALVIPAVYAPVPALAQHLTLSRTCAVGRCFLILHANWRVTVWH